jgi:hypothetical protein
MSTQQPRDLHCCAEMQDHLADSEVPVVYNEKFREYGIRIMDGGTSVQTILYCPWCGRQLPDSLRYAWFERLNQLGLEPDDELPQALQSDAWWRKTDSGLSSATNSRNRSKPRRGGKPRKRMDS